MKHILVTNDDGFNAPGLQVVFKESNKLGEAVIIAPEHETISRGYLWHTTCCSSG